jgi:hypothetical protein
MRLKLNHLFTIVNQNELILILDVTKVPKPLKFLNKNYRKNEILLFFLCHLQFILSYILQY